MPLAVITGASSGIGKEYALALAKQGYDLVLVARRAPLLNALKVELEAAHHVKVTNIIADLSLHEDVVLLSKQLAPLPVELLFNNAGAGASDSFFKSDIERVDSLVHLLIDALTYLTHAVGNQMAARGGGKIVNISSIVSFWPATPSYVLYGAAKRYVSAFSEGLDRENALLNNKVRVITVNPGAIATEFAARATGDQSADITPSFGTPTAEFVRYTLPRILSGEKAVISYGQFARNWAFINRPALPKKLIMRIFERQTRRFKD